MTQHSKGSVANSRKNENGEEAKKSAGAKDISKTDLQCAIHNHLLDSGFSKNEKGYFIAEELSKQKVRDLHAPNRREQLQANRYFVNKFGSALMHNFAHGREINPEAIKPKLVEVISGTQESKLFRLATLLWSVPVSQGFGRRIRFLVRDRQNGKLIGLFALGDPVFNLSARDKLIGWTSDDRKKRLIHVMDAYVVGAVPPYSQLIGGKLVAALMGSVEVRNVYNRKYLNKTSIISGATKRARLVLITTTSALGRSSLYNRLAIPGGIRSIRIGVTKGFGHFHLSGEIFEMMRRYLQQKDHPYASGNRFGMGPNWRLRVARAALEDIGFNGDGVLKHGIEREVHVIPLAKNWKEILLGMQKKVHPCVLPASKISEYCLRRWIIPRSYRDKRFKDFTSSSIMYYLQNGGPPSAW
jgi:hypothetical protein